MESTGKYWIPVFNILESSCNIVLAHPKYVKAIRGKKTEFYDKKASWAGLTPTNNKSAVKKKSVRISKVGCFVKPLLV